MDYEKKYNEALERARKIHDEIVNNEVLGFPGQITDIFPELCESEDERIRKYLLGMFPDPDDSWDGISARDIIAYLEKQKENPKTADSIPSDCMSDEKCEDRWHKVGDSLPDNGRLVLANDCLGNTLLARYDGEGNWEVSVYDNDDYYCRNTITKWCDIPSEKQKEPENVSATTMAPSCWEVEQKEQKQEQKEVDLEKEIENEWRKCNPTDEGMGSEYAIITVEQFDAIARHFYEL